MDAVCRIGGTSETSVFIPRLLAKNITIKIKMFLQSSNGHLCFFFLMQYDGEIRFEKAEKKKIGVEKWLQMKRSKLMEDIKL